MSGRSPEPFWLHRLRAGYPGRHDNGRIGRRHHGRRARDGERFTAPDAALVQLQIDGLSHRYIRTTATREIDGRRLLVYNYDGEIR